MFLAVEIFVVEQSVNVNIYLCVCSKSLVWMCVNVYFFVVVFFLVCECVRVCARACLVLSF